MSHVCVPEYPNIDQVIPAITNVIDYLRGKPGVDAGCALHCSWVLTGVGLSYVPHDHSPVTQPLTLAESANRSRDELADILESAKFQIEAAGSGEGMRAIDWRTLFKNTILPIAMTVIQRLILGL